MQDPNGCWEAIFQQQGRLFHEPANIVVKLVERLKEHNCQKVLDLGCGSGRHTVFLAQQGFRVIGLDNSPTGLRLTESWLTDQGVSAGLVLADTRWPLPFHVAAFDALLSVQVIHHAYRAAVVGTIQEISRLVRPGGVLLVTVSAKLDPNIDYLEIEPNTYVPLAGKEKGLPHHLFSPEEVASLFGDFQKIELRVLASIVIVFLAVKK